MNKTLEFGMMGVIIGWGGVEVELADGGPDFKVRDKI